MVFTYIAYDTVYLIASILLIIGTLKSKAAYLIPYIVCSVIGMVCAVGFSIVFFVLIKDTVQRTTLGCFPLISIPLQIAFCVVVGIFHRQLKAKNHYVVV